MSRWVRSVVFPRSAVASGFPDNGHSPKAEKGPRLKRHFRRRVGASWNIRFSPDSDRFAEIKA